jgi:hypothetical protein
MSKPLGLGWWVAFERSIDAGPKAADLAKALAVCEATGARWVCLRAGDGGHPDADLTEASILAFKAAGLQVFLWPFVYGHALSGTLAILKHWRGLCLPGGAPAVDGVILNAEFDFESVAPALARSLVGDVRALGYDFVGHAPPDFAGGRGDGPFPALDDACDAIMPQCYAWEHNDGGHIHTIDAVLSLYRKRGLYLDKVNPVLCSYRPKVRGYTKTEPKQPIPTAPLAGEAEIVARDVVAGLDHVDALGGCEAPSIYTIDAMTGGWAARKGVGEAVLAALVARAGPVKQTLPDGGLDLGDTDRVPATSIADESHRLAELHTLEDEPDTLPETREAKTKSGSMARVDPDATLDGEKL